MLGYSGEGISATVLGVDGVGAGAFPLGSGTLPGESEVLGRESPPTSCRYPCHGSLRRARGQLQPIPQRVA